MANSNLVEFMESKLNKTYFIGITKDNNKLVNVANHLKSNKGSKNGLNYVKGKGKITFKHLFNILNDRYEFLKKMDLSPKNKDVINIVKFLVKNINNPNVGVKQIENGYLALLVNVINRKEFGSNAESTIYQKGFDFVMKDTGSFIKQLKVWTEGKI